MYFFEVTMETNHGMLKSFDETKTKRCNRNEF